jgi:hypothetical protein
MPLAVVSLFGCWMITIRRYALVCGFTILFWVRQLSAETLYLETFESANVPIVPSGWVVTEVSMGDVVASLAAESTFGNPGKNLRLTVDGTNATYWSATARYQWHGDFPTTNLSQLSFTVDIQASEEGKTIWMYLLSHGTNGETNGKAFLGAITTTSYSQMGGLLSTFENLDILSFDPTASMFTMIFQMSSDFGFDSGNYLRIDNVKLSYLPPPVPGDFDSNGYVDGADFMTWQSHFPMSTNATLATGDADSDGDVDGADFVVWQTNFRTLPGFSTTVPEPSSLLLAIICLAVIGGIHFKLNLLHLIP